MLGYRKLSPTILFIFGGGGDLNYRKLNPALFNLFLDNAMSDSLSIVGIDRIEYSEPDYKKHLKKGIDTFSRTKATDGKWRTFSANISYLIMDVTDAKAYKKIAQIVKEKETEAGVPPVIIFYMAVASQLVPEIIKHIGKMSAYRDTKHTRVVVEKPFGHDLKSAIEMNKFLGEFFEEEQIYRIDHYLGKETVQNIIALRFANSLFEPIWNRNYIDHVQITAAETVGVEKRGGYYETAGALRDMIQNHMLQLLCMIGMEPPVSFEADEMRDKKTSVLKAMRIISKDEVQHHAARGQYSGGWIQGKKVQGYREEKDVNPQSNVETFTAVKFYINNWRWEGGDATLFMRGDQVEAAWKVVMPILEVWAESKPTDFPDYSPDSWGPKNADALIARDGRNWIITSSETKGK